MYRRFEATASGLDPEVGSQAVEPLCLFPLLSGAMWLLRSPNATTSDAISLVESAAILWWTGLVQAAPSLFVVVAAVLVWAGADEVLD